MTTKVYRCRQCGKPMPIMEAITGTVCQKCCRENHRKAVKGR